MHALDTEGNDNFRLHFRFELIDYKLGKKVKRTIWGGEKEGGSVSYEILSILRNVYLSALRNTNKDLRPIKGNIVGNLYSNLRIDEDKDKDKEKKDNLLEKVIELLDGEEWQEFISTGNNNILEHLGQLSYLTDEKRQKVQIGFAPFEFDDFVQNLFMQLPIYPDDLIDDDNPQKYFDITQNGLGYNNLIYTAAVLGDIKERKNISKEEYTLLLIEEPEAHLHPQLQNTFFNYLEELNKTDDFQIIVTSHSPTITAKTDLKLLTVLQNYHNTICATQINKLSLDNKSIKYLQKFLDVTKSQLFFSNGVILVEGISEALLVPIFSRILGDNYDIERNGVEVVNVNGVAFEHFTKLFNSENEEERLECRCAIITDDDEGKEGSEERIAKIKSDEGGNLNSFIGNKTFEIELFKNNYENECLLKIIEYLHPRKFSIINDSSRSVDDRAEILVNTLSNSQNKSEFAYLLAIELEMDEDFHDFKVPSYIEEAIKFVIDEPILKF